MSNVQGKWASTGRGRDLFPGHQNGKGDKNRTSNDEQYRKNYDEINWTETKSESADNDSGSASVDSRRNGVNADSQSAGIADALAEHFAHCDECRTELGIGVCRCEICSESKSETRSLSALPPGENGAANGNI